MTGWSWRTLGRAGAGREAAGADTSAPSYDLIPVDDGHSAESRPAGDISVVDGHSAESRPAGDVGLRLPTPVLLVLSAVLVAAVWRRDFLAGVVVMPMLVPVLAVRSHRGRTGGWLLVFMASALTLSFVGATRSEAAWRAVEPDTLGPFAGWVKVIDDPQPYAASTRVIVEVDGERYEVWGRGRARQRQLGTWRGGQWVHLSGTRLAVPAERAHRVAWQHVVGSFDVDWVGGVRPGGPLERASNRVRGTIERAGALLPAPYGALFRGLVVGDDRDQPPAMVRRFRASGLSHLTAVSGQNVALVLAAAGPLLTRLRPWPRWAATVGLVTWFVMLTRFEPSIVRAGAMAGLSATAFLLGRERAPVRLLAVAVIGLVLVDPLIVGSVGFWLSVGATAGVSAVGPWLAARLGALGSAALPVGITLGAQVGVALPSLLVFDRLAVVSVPANLAAVPVATAVMLYGLPVGLVAGAITDLAPGPASMLMWPARVGTRWIDTVAALGERLEPGPPWSWLGWCLVWTMVVAIAAIGSVRDKNRRRHDHPAADR